MKHILAIMVMCVNVGCNNKSESPVVIPEVVIPEPVIPEPTPLQLDVEREAFEARQREYLTPKPLVTDKILLTASFYEGVKVDMYNTCLRTSDLTDNEVKTNLCDCYSIIRIKRLKEFAKKNNIKYADDIPQNDKLEEEIRSLSAICLSNRLGNEQTQAYIEITHQPIGSKRIQ